MTIERYFPTSQHPEQGFGSWTQENQPEHFERMERFATFSRSGDYHVVQVWPKWAAARAVENIMEWFARNLFGWQVPCFRNYKIVPVYELSSSYRPNVIERRIDAKFQRELTKARELFDVTVAAQRHANSLGILTSFDIEALELRLGSLSNQAEQTLGSITARGEKIGSFKTFSNLFDSIAETHQRLIAGRRNELTAMVQSFHSDLNEDGFQDLRDFYWTFENFEAFEAASRRVLGDDAMNEMRDEIRIQRFREAAEWFAHYKYVNGMAEREDAFNAWLNSDELAADLALPADGNE